MVQIGDVVTTKKIGNPLVGEVCCVCSAPFLNTVLRSLETCSAVSCDRNEWDRLYPDWQTELCVIVRLEEPIKPMNYTKYKDYLMDHNDTIRTHPAPDVIVEYFYNQMMSYHLFGFPVQDIEVIE